VTLVAVADHFKQHAALLFVPPHLAMSSISSSG
jgi:hypothetical protein